MVDSDAVRIEKAIRKVQKSGDESALIEVLLQDALNWPLADEDDENIEIDDISYSWDDVLVEMGFSTADAPIELRQVMPFPNWPHGIFIVKFGSSKFFTQGRGMTTPLRTILRELMEKVRPTADHPSWKKDHLLFLCHSETEYFQFARFEDPKGDSKTSKLQMFGWGPNDHIRTVCEYNLKNLIYKQGMNEDEATEAVASAFDVSKVSKRFYEDYKKAFENAKPIIAENASITDANEIHQTTQTLFNRILFLRFIEKKGWLHFGETDDYLRELFKAGGVSSSTFYSSRLKRLFFEGLAIEGKQNNSAYGDVAFLNGGLFEESKFDKAITDLPDEMFEPLLGENGLFYNYNFTVQESTPLDIDVAIDPEMIGTMFEELVTGRNEKGAFYTPRVVVAYMCREAIKSVLEERTEVNAESIRKLIDDDDNEGLSIVDARTINSVLAEVKAIDPACGSGAYLLGLLHELVRIHTKLSTTAEDLTESRHKMKLRIISRSIYGVDLDPFATNIAMLRLWLSLSVEAPEPLPLPNLDFNIETGDSLLAPDPSAYVFDVTGALEKADALALKKEIYLEATGDNARELRTEIKTEEADIRKLLRKKNDEIGSVDFRVHFASVFTKNGGFDIVLANPPYVNAIEHGKTNPVQRKIITKNYFTATRTWDLYIPFIERSQQLLRVHGVSVFINPNKYLAAPYALSLREFILKKFNIHSVVDLSSFNVFSSASVYPVVSVFKKTSKITTLKAILPPKDLAVSDDYSIDRFIHRTIDYSMLKFSEDLVWGLLLSHNSNLLVSLHGSIQPLKQFYKIRATTTASEADDYGQYLVDDVSCDGYKVINTGTIDPNKSLWGVKKMRHSGSAYLHPIIQSNCISSNRQVQYSNRKILFAKLAISCESFLDSKGEYAGFNINSIEELSDQYPLEFVYGFTISTLFDIIYDTLYGALRMQGGYLQFQAPQLRAMLLPNTSLEFRNEITDLVKRNLGEDISSLRDKLDNAFRTHLNLNY